jgi:hypothetical protein
LFRKRLQENIPSIKNNKPGKERLGMGKHKLTKKLISIVETLLKEGHYNETVAQAAGISEKSFYHYLSRGEEVEEELEECESEQEVTYILDTMEQDDNYRYMCYQFSQAVKRGNQEAEMKALQNIRKAGRKTWQAEAWFLERKFRHKWGRVIITEDSNSNNEAESGNGMLNNFLNGVKDIARNKLDE